MRVKMVKTVYFLLNLGSDSLFGFVGFVCDLTDKSKIAAFRGIKKETNHQDHQYLISKKQMQLIRF